MSGSEFINAVHIRCNCLYSRARATLGREANRLCSRGCRVPEILNHIVHQCYSTHGSRITRHNAVCNYVARSLEHKGYFVNKEPIFRMPDGRKLNPDLVTYATDHSLVIDAQIINDQFPLKVAHEAKIDKYEVLRPQLQPLRPNGVFFTTFTMNWRGAISQEILYIVPAATTLRDKGDCGQIFLVDVEDVECFPEHEFHEKEVLPYV